MDLDLRLYWQHHPIQFQTYFSWLQQSFKPRKCLIETTTQCFAAGLMHFPIQLKSLGTHVGAGQRSIYFWCSERLPPSSPACFIFKSAAVDTTWITAGLLLHFSLSLCQSLIFFLSKLKQLFYKWTPFVPLQNNDLSFRPVKRLVGPELSPHALSSLEIKRKTLRCSHRRDLGPHLATSNDVNNCNAAAKTASSLFLHLCLQKIAD